MEDLDILLERAAAPFLHPFDPGQRIYFLYLAGAIVLGFFALSFFYGAFQIGTPRYTGELLALGVTLGIGVLFALGAKAAWKAGGERARAVPAKSEAPRSSQAARKWTRLRRIPGVVAAILWGLILALVVLVLLAGTARARSPPAFHALIAAANSPT